MANVISLVSSKGGTGKTTTALNLALALAELGRRTLLCDLDPQGAIALALARGDTEWPGLAELALGAESLGAVVLETKVPTLEILPRGRLDPVDACTFEEYAFDLKYKQRAIGARNVILGTAVVHVVKKAHA